MQNRSQKRTVSPSNTLRNDVIAEEKAALTIQTFFKRHQAQQKYHIEKLPPERQTNGHVYVKGNDPSIDKLHEYKSLDNEPIAIIGTSGLRALEIACELRHPHNKAKLIIIDNSTVVCQFWRNLRNICEFSPSKTYLQQYINLFYGKNQEFCEYFLNLVNKYGYDVVKNTIKHTTIFNQSWATPGLFKKIRNTLDYIGIAKTYAYPSNILACIIEYKDKPYKASMLENIESLNPILAIHTDLHPLSYKPKKVFYLTDQTPSHVRKQVLHYDRILKPS